MLNKQVIFMALFLLASCVYSQLEIERLWMEKAKLSAPKQKPGDGFGYSIAQYKDTAIISSPRDHSDGLGRVYVFRGGGKKELLEDTFVSDTPYEHFGESVALYENIAVVGAWGMETAYVFRYDKDKHHWVKEAQLKAHDAKPNIYFGYSVAVYKDMVVVAAPRENTKGNGAGAIYTFYYNAKNKHWAHHSKLVASNGYAGDIFGSCISFDKNVLLVGAYGKSIHGYSSGAAYVFRRSKKGIWKEEAMLLAADNEIADFFGCSVGISNNTVIIGAHGEDSKGEGTGAAYVFSYDAKKKSWREKAKLHCSDVQNSDFLGHSVSISENTIVVGAYGKNKKSGAAYIFENTNGNWIEKAKLTASDAKYGDRFAKAVSIYQRHVLIGARCLEFNKYSPGIVYLFERELQK